MECIRIWKSFLFIKGGLPRFGFVKRLNIPFSSKRVLILKSHGSLTFSASLYDATEALAYKWRVFNPSSNNPPMLVVYF